MATAPAPTTATRTAPSVDTAARARAAWLAGAGIVLIAFNLRLGISSAAALLEALRGTLGFGPVTASLMPTLPTLCFAAAGLTAAPLARRLGTERAVLVALVALAAGLGVRAVPSTWALLTGTVFGMSGLAVGNVLLPALLRAHFPRRVSMLTGVYTTVMALGATLAAAVAVPVAGGLGSPSLGLAVWALPAVVALLVWSLVRAPHALTPKVATAAGAEAAAAARQAAYVSPWTMARTRIGRLCTAYFALQALNCYALVGWLPTLLSDEGMSRGGAGAMLAITQGAGIPATFAILAFVRATGRLRPAFVVVSVSMLIGFVGLLVAPVAVPVLWAAAVGLGFCSFPLVLSVIGGGGSNAAETTALSTLAQSLGYAVAATGPFALGLMHGATGGWAVPMAALVVTALGQLVVGLVLSGPGAGAPDTAAGDTDGPRTGNRREE
ncbi:MFS transporter [Embleya sp. NBC_00896]|uniref:MFS transporter n=1 Tax=Embleya sp. NBC_00896 TaxID=2975961 RepID=UPI0038688123|nr:MFS transporter [Embleya sp. NBC_00896]